jgi:hypothetical protein
MFSKSQILFWKNQYNSSIYPPIIYKELVVDQLYHERRIEFFGAWKNGCFRILQNGRDYTDRNGVTYKLTNRWKESCPVGYNTWIEVSKKQDAFKTLIPYTFPAAELRIVSDLKKMDGFGFVWSVAILHCFQPEVFPLYDQHVYRAYKAITNHSTIEIKTAPGYWETYSEYSDFFKRQTALAGLPFWIVDMALWAFGKNLKKPKIQTPVLVKPNLVVHKNILTNSSSWIQEFTLGGKAKSFNWRIDDDFNLILKIDKRYKTVSAEELDSIYSYVGTISWTDLANNVEKLNNNEEKDGLGKFLHEMLNWSASESMVASQIAAIFVRLQIWNYNGKKRGIRFKRAASNWRIIMKRTREERDRGF